MLAYVAALLFKLEAAVRLGYTSTACTEELCKWNQSFVSDVQPAPVMQIKFYKAESKAALSRTRIMLCLSQLCRCIQNSQLTSNSF